MKCRSREVSIFEKSKLWWIFILIVAFAISIWIIVASSISIWIYDDESANNSKRRENPDRNSIGENGRFVAKSAWSDLSPFETISCGYPENQKSGSSACNPSIYESEVDFSQLKVEAKAQLVLSWLEEGQFDKTRFLVESLSECHSLHKLEVWPNDTGVNFSGSSALKVCNLLKVEEIVEEARKILFTAAQHGDYAARQPFVNLLIARAEENENLRYFYSANNAPPSDPNLPKQLQEKIDRDYDQVIKYIEVLKDPTTDLLDIAEQSRRVRDSSNN